MSIAEIDEPCRVAGGGHHDLRDVLERERHAVERLDDPVVEVTADAVALPDDRQVADLLVQMGVVDRDAGV